MTLLGGLQANCRCQGQDEALAVSLHATLKSSAALQPNLRVNFGGRRIKGLGVSKVVGAGTASHCTPQGFPIKYCVWAWMKIKVWLLLEPATCFCMNC